MVLLYLQYSCKLVTSDQYAHSMVVNASNTEPIVESVCGFNSGLKVTCSISAFTSAGESPLAVTEGYTALECKYTIGSSSYALICFISKQHECDCSMNLIVKQDAITAKNQLGSWRYTHKFKKYIILIIDFKIISNNKGSHAKNLVANGKWNAFV